MVLVVPNNPVSLRLIGYIPRNTVTAEIDVLPEMMLKELFVAIDVAELGELGAGDETIETFKKFGAG